MDKNLYKMKTLIVGGNFGDEPKKSSIVSKISDEFVDSKVLNGGNLDELPFKINSELIIWMPNISNETKKQYPFKSIGNVLIVSKVMREGYTHLDAISRIFSMRGNAVIAIFKEEKFRFVLIDALGNVWYDGSDIKNLTDKIKDFYFFTKSAIRVRTVKDNNIVSPNKNEELDKFIEINKKLSNFVQTSCGERFFGNLSTRCAKLFPTIRNEVGIFVSPRNSNKEFITSEDMVYCEFKNDNIYYVGNNKPSVDTPSQLEVYNNCDKINYMIHGHAFINGATETDEYFLCGDLREAKEVISIIGDSKFGAINLKNHGFLIYSDTLENLKNVIDGLTFSYGRISQNEQEKIIT